MRPWRPAVRCALCTRVPRSAVFLAAPGPHAPWPPCGRPREACPRKAVPGPGAVQRCSQVFPPAALASARCACVALTCYATRVRQVDDNVDVPRSRARIFQRVREPPAPGPSDLLRAPRYRASHPFRARCRPVSPAGYGYGGGIGGYTSYAPGPMPYQSPAPSYGGYGPPPGYGGGYYGGDAGMYSTAGSINPCPNPSYARPSCMLKRAVVDHHRASLSHLWSVHIVSRLVYNVMSRQQ